MKCTGERPRCKNCEIYEQECVFNGPSRKPRPTNAALNELMEENRRLRERFSDGTPGQVHTEVNHNDIHAGQSPNEIDPGANHRVNTTGVNYSESHTGPNHNVIPPEQTTSGEHPSDTTPAEPVRRESDDLIETPASVGSTTYHGTYARVHIPQNKPQKMAFPPPSPSPTLSVALQDDVTSNRESKEIRGPNQSLWTMLDTG
jgi:hypothetical protein